MNEAIPLQSYYDMRKIQNATAEMFWRGAFAGNTVEVELSKEQQQQWGIPTVYESPA